VEDHLMMTDPDRGTDRGGRRAKRFLSPWQEYKSLAERTPQSRWFAVLMAGLGFSRRAR
jgi:hypothetical protein